MTEANTPSLFPCDDLEPVLTALADDTNCLVLVIGTDGIVHWINDAVVAASGRARDAIINAPLSDMFPAAYVDERLRFIREAATTGHPVACEGLTRGTYRRTTYRPLKHNGERSNHVLAVCRPQPQGTAPTAPQSDMPIRRAAYDDLGPLASLTERELELLDLIGRGLTTAQIAAHLGRSSKTVEWHRVSLGEKLNAANRVELARIALNAGLSGGSLPMHSNSAPAPSTPPPQPPPSAREVEPKPFEAPGSTKRPPP